MVMNPAESSEFIIANAKDVKVIPEGVNKLAGIVIEAIQNNKIDPQNFSQNQLHPNANDQHAIDWIFLVDTLNFCFWPAQDKKKWQVNGHTGYFALCAAINRAMSEGIEILNPKFYSQIDEDKLRYIFRPDTGHGELDLLEERKNSLHEVGMILLEKYNGKFENCVRESCNSAEKLLKLIVIEFPCYRDENIYNGETVSFYKRAQILIGDIWSCYRGKGIGEFYDIDKITMFADYRVPQVLIHFGCIEYTDQLTKALLKDQPNLCSTNWESEIRGASIFVVELLKKIIKDKINNEHKELASKPINSIVLDHFLWDYRRENAKELEHIPFHKVKSIFY